MKRFEYDIKRSSSHVAPAITIDWDGSRLCRQSANLRITRKDAGDGADGTMTSDLFEAEIGGNVRERLGQSCRTILRLGHRAWAKALAALLGTSRGVLSGSEEAASPIRPVVSQRLIGMLSFCISSISCGNGFGSMTSTRFACSRVKHFGSVGDGRFRGEAQIDGLRRRSVGSLQMKDVVLPQEENRALAMQARDGALAPRLRQGRSVDSRESARMVLPTRAARARAPRAPVVTDRRSQKRGIRCGGSGIAGPERLDCEVPGFASRAERISSRDVRHIPTARKHCESPWRVRGGRDRHPRDSPAQNFPRARRRYRDSRA